MIDETRLVRPDGTVWTRIRPTGFTLLIGPMWHREEDGRHMFGIEAQPKHDNSVERAHGGLTMAFCDEALGIASHFKLVGDRLLTVSFDCQFIGAARIGSFLEIEPELVKATRSIAFMRGTCTADGEVIATCAGVWKRMGESSGRKA